MFNGRAARPEYWWFALFGVLVAIGLSIITTPMLLSVGPGESPSVGASGLVSLLYLGMLIGVGLPGLAVTVRRLHDTGRSGWFWFIGLIPFIGAIIMIVFLVQPGDPGTNTYGEPPA